MYEQTDVHRIEKMNGLRKLLCSPYFLYEILQRVEILRDLEISERGSAPDPAPFFEKEATQQAAQKASVL